MRIRARFRPHRRGFGFLTPVADDQATAVTVAVPAADGAVTETDRVFVPPPQARALVADDLVEAEVVVGDKGVVAESVTLVRRLRRLLVGTVERRRGGLVVACDGALSSGWLPLEEQLEGQLGGHDGEQVVVLARLGEAGAPVGQALVSGPHPAASPHAVRARAVALVLGDTLPSSQGVGPAAVGLDPSAADTLHLRLMGQLASGRRGAAAGLHAGGPVPGAALDGVDRREEPCVTVDGPASRELDDAVAAAWDGDVASPVHVAVHITDVADVIGVDSDADRYARTVASTAYLTSAPSAPMLDPAVSDSTRSLLPGQDRPALSVRFAVRPDGAVDAAHVEPAWIRSHARLTYQAVEAWLAGEPKPVRTQSDVGGQAIEPTVRAALEAARRLGAERDARLTLEALFDQAELAPVVVDDEVTVALAEPHAQAYRLIERLMVAANETVGGWLAARGVPALYRAHEGIDPAADRRGPRGRPGPADRRDDRLDGPCHLRPRPVAPPRSGDHGLLPLHLAAAALRRPGGPPPGARGAGRRDPAPRRRRALGAVGLADGPRRGAVAAGGPRTRRPVGPRAAARRAVRSRDRHRDGHHRGGAARAPGPPGAVGLHPRRAGPRRRRGGPARDAVDRRPRADHHVGAVAGGLAHRRGLRRPRRRGTGQLAPGLRVAMRRGRCRRCRHRAAPGRWP
ncbi:MAG: hypothetical protein BRC31_02920 [Actinobacteria bacterium QS_5_72_10]|nr:MAG: hypothetical protein BRC31_02920 [Actinobacteria bacterium QS_5_72_10]